MASNNSGVSLLTAIAVACALGATAGAGASKERGQKDGAGQRPAREISQKCPPGGTVCMKETPGPSDAAPAPGPARPAGPPTEPAEAPSQRPEVATPTEKPTDIASPPAAAATAAAPQPPAAYEPPPPSELRDREPQPPFAPTPPGSVVSPATPQDNAISMLPWALSTAFGAMAAMAVWRKRYLNNRIEAARKALAREFGSDFASLEQGMEQLARYMNEAAGRVERYQRTIDEMQASPGPRPASIALALSMACDEATKAMDALSDDADYRELSDVIPVASCFRRLGGMLEAGAESAVGKVLWTALSQGDLDAPLTLPVLLEAYYPSDGAWGLAQRAAGAVEALLRLALARDSVETFVVKPLTRVRGRGTDLSDGGLFDTRKIRTLSRAKTAVGKIAASLQPGEHLIVDCRAPGFVSPTRGASPPILTYYNPSAW
jgi:hypothetical protein